MSFDLLTDEEMWKLRGHSEPVDDEDKKIAEASQAKTLRQVWEFFLSDDWGLGKDGQFLFSAFKQRVEEEGITLGEVGDV